MAIHSTVRFWRTVSKIYVRPALTDLPFIILTRSKLAFASSVSPSLTLGPSASGADFSE
jgi:hypothetical protein